MRHFFIQKISLLLLVGALGGCQSEQGSDGQDQGFHLEKGMNIELIASEPLVIDPVAFAFDENERMYVVEDRGYPDSADGGTATTIGRIALLEDIDGDGVYDKRHEFVTGLTYPNGIMPWKGGVFVTCSPHIYYFKDTDGDGVADVKEVVLTGFHDTRTSQIRMSHPTLGLDGWIYVTGGLNGGDITSPLHPDRDPVSFTAADGRFNPETLEFQVTGGKSQFGLSIDSYGRRFGTSNRHPVMQAVVEPWYLKRNPNLVFNETIQNVSKVEAEAVVYPISSSVTTADYIPRLMGRSHAGTFTAASGLVVFNGMGLTDAHRGNVFICESAQNLVQRQVMREHGASFTSEIAIDGEEFLSSTDEWFRPVFAQHGPRGGLYIADMYRKVIDHPSYVPEEMRDKLDFESGKDMGRVYRVFKKGFKKKEKDTDGSVAKGASITQLIAALSSDDEWKRYTAFRILVADKEKDAVVGLKETVLKSDIPEGRARALWLLYIYEELDEETLSATFKDTEAGVREQAVHIFLLSRDKFEGLKHHIFDAADDESSRVRFLAAVALGELPTDSKVSPLVKIAVRDGEDRWTRTAVLSGIHSHTKSFLSQLISADFSNSTAFSLVIQDVGKLLGTEGNIAESREFVKYLLNNAEFSDWHIAALLGLVEGLTSNSGYVKTASANGVLSEIAGPENKQGLDNFFKALYQIVLDENRTPSKRANALALFGFTNFEKSGDLLWKVLDTKVPVEIQLKAVEAIARLRDVRGAELLVQKEKWSSYSPNVKSAVISALVSNQVYIETLFKGIEEERISPSEVSSLERSRLIKSEVSSIKKKANELFKELEGGDRMAVYKAYREVLNLDAEAKKGALIFKSHCAVCHTYEGSGGHVGPDLTSVKNQPADALLLHTLVPNYEVYPAYQSIAIKTKGGKTFSGWVVSENENGLTIRTAYGADESILRENIETLSNSGLSLMPDGLEQSMSKQDLANLIKYLKNGL